MGPAAAAGCKKGGRWWGRLWSSQPCPCCRGGREKGIERPSLGKVLSTFLSRLLSPLPEFQILVFPEYATGNFAIVDVNFAATDRVLFAGGLGKGSGKLLFYHKRATLDANTASVRKGRKRPPVVKRRRTVSLKIQCFVQTPLSYITYMHLLFAVGGECVFLKRRRPFFAPI